MPPWCEPAALDATEEGWHCLWTPPTLLLTLSPGSMESADAVLDGIRLAELAEELPVGRSSVFELLKRLAIVTGKGPDADGRGRVAWVSNEQADRLRAAAHAVHTGARKIADFSSAITTRALPTKRAPSAPSPDSADPTPFLARLEAAERAVASGFGLTTAEVSWILGVTPGSSPVTRGGITATRTGKNCWLLSKA